MTPSEMSTPNVFQLDHPMSGHLLSPVATPSPRRISSFARAVIRSIRRASVASSGASSLSRLRLTVADFPSSEIRMRRSHFGHSSSLTAGESPAAKAAPASDTASNTPALFMLIIAYFSPVTVEIGW